MRIKRTWWPPIRATKRGRDLIMDPLFNKGVAFKHAERDRLDLRGLLPPRRLPMQLQIERFLTYMRSLPTPIAKNRALEDLHDRNETLYHRILVDYIEEVAPLVYTPVVGKACLEFSSQYRKPRGLFISLEDRGHMAAIVHNVPQNDIHVIVVTDGSRILGLGDLGVQGMGIPIGKLSLYCACGGLGPHRVLPVTLDAGTDNPALLNDPYYIGLQQPRVRGSEYFAFVDEFMHAVRHRWPQALVQFEDFASERAQKLLDHYRHNFFVFNDDIQGTGAVTLAGLLSALRAAGGSPDDLGNQRVLICGAGSAGVGVATEVWRAMQYQGMNPDDAAMAIRIVDQYGLVGPRDTLDQNPSLARFAVPDAAPAGFVASPSPSPSDPAPSIDDDEDTSLHDQLPLIDVIRRYKPTMLLGLTACGGLFTPHVLRAMGSVTERPIIFALSNPTHLAECTAEEAYTHTEGRAIFASGSPFGPVTMTVPGESVPRTFRPSQVNNMFIFPGLGMGLTLAGAGTVSDEMLYNAAVTLANTTSDADIAHGSVFPPLSTIRDVSARVASETVRLCIDRDLAPRILPRHTDEGLEKFVRRKMYDPCYVPLVGGYWPRQAD
eukprot:TRINITY_DN32740_c0_g1_i1.p1 TRINITY_DN32740_c0_g1~~TRINITY_DN32740_c0_g1_i1.p1  ORF type:complete len:605 (+),score=127.19 TRINITY_DN32740_c0_g1_i1:58-1872(+)